MATSPAQFDVWTTAATKIETCIYTLSIVAAQAILNWTTTATKIETCIYIPSIVASQAIANWARGFIASVGGFAAGTIAVVACIGFTTIQQAHPNSFC